MYPKLSDIIGIINKKFPFRLSEEWDNSGLQLGEPAAEIRKIMVALDPLPSVIDEAISLDCQLLVTHHPLIFKPLYKITGLNTTGMIIIKAVRNGLALLAMHTNYDIADDGLNDLLANRIGLTRTSPLKVNKQADLAKLVVYVPADHLDDVRTAMFPFAQSSDNYQNCSFASPGEGTFLPLAGAIPAIGTVGRLETVAEQRLELLIHRDKLPNAIKRLLKVHPYQEPAFDCYPLLQESNSTGLGRIGNLEVPAVLKDIALTIGRKLGVPSLRLTGDPSRIVQKIALCSGSGASLLHEAVHAGADMLLTGDIKYHEAREAEAMNIALLDAGHFYTERLMVDAVMLFLHDAIKATGHNTELFGATTEHDPFLNVAVT